MAIGHIVDVFRYRLAARNYAQAKRLAGIGRGSVIKGNGCTSRI